MKPTINIDRRCVHKAVVTESVDQAGNKIKNYAMKGTTVVLNKRGANRRLYPTNVMQPALESYLESFSLGRNTYGCLDHPADDAHDLNYVNPKEISHLFTKIETDGDEWYSESKVLDSPNGQIVKSIIDVGGTLGISTRGFGDSVDTPDGEDMIGYEFITIGDYVVDPSASGAYLEAVMERSDWLYRNGIIKNKAETIERHIDQVRQDIKTESAKVINERATKYFNNYLKLLK